MSERRAYLLALSEPLASRNEDAPRGLCSSCEETEELLLGSWGIKNSHDLVSTLEWLRDEGHRHEFQRRGSRESEGRYLAWDLARLAQLTRWGVRAGYLETKSAWRWLEQVADLAARSFPSWNDYLEDYLAGYEQWSDDPQERAGVAAAIVEVKKRSLPTWSPPAKELGGLLARWSALRLKLGAASLGRLAAGAVLCVAASILCPWPLGAGCVAAILVVLVTHRRLWGPGLDLLLTLLGLSLTVVSVAGGLLRAYLPEGAEMPFATCIFALLSFYIAASTVAYSDDRTPMP